MEKTRYSLNIRTIRIATFLWALPPVLLTLVFWFRWYFSVPSVALLIWASVRMVKSLGVVDASTRQSLPLTKGVWAILILLLPWMVFVGVGGFIGQEEYDNAFRNAVLEELTYRPWPVVDTQFKPFAYMSYYFSYWLPAALVGKAFMSYDVSQVFLFVYCYIGLALTALMVMHYCGRRFFLVGVLLFCFCGLDEVNRIVFCDILCWNQNIGNPSLVFGAPMAWNLVTYIYNQGIPAWAILMLMLSVRHRLGLQLLLFSLLFTCAPFPALAVAPILGVGIIRHLKESFSVCNIAGFVVCLLMSVFYAGNGNGTGLSTIFDGDVPFYRIAFFFIGWSLFNFVIIIPFIWKEIKNGGYSLFFGLFATSFLFSLLRPGSEGYDFGWKLPMAFTGYFVLLVAKHCADMDWSSKSLKSWVFALLLILGSTSNAYMWKSSFFRINYLLRSPKSPGLPYRANFLQDKLFDPEANGCYESFVTDKPTLYSKYFMPKWEESRDCNRMQRI